MSQTTWTPLLRSLGIDRDVRDAIRASGSGRLGKTTRGTVTRPFLRLARPVRASAQTSTGRDMVHTNGVPCGGPRWDRMRGDAIHTCAGDANGRRSHAGDLAIALALESAAA